MKIILLGKPQSTNNLYRRHGHVMYMTNEGKSIKQSYIYQAKQQYKGEILTGDIEVSIKLVFTDKRRRDIDNWNKILFDSLTGVIWKDDSQIIKMTIEKVIETVPKIEIDVQSIK